MTDRRTGPPPRRIVAVTAAAVIVAGLPSCGRAIPGHPVAVSSPPATSAPSAPGAPAPPPPSDEDQVRQTVMAFQDAYNTQKWDDYRALMCTAMRDRFTDAAMDLLKKTRAAQGLTNVTVTGVDVDGDAATATLDAQNEMLGRRTIQLKLAREDGWKVCVLEPVR
ncbi:nuclear transport factor 2 family protein [Mycobacterium sp. pUA109]|uniref:Rv0361 family membrane protein n=1 Tax=Mycobacterium sp. pUA109 TaxID=3238982 RepID=UPI00351BC81C